MSIASGIYDETKPNPPSELNSKNPHLQVELELLLLRHGVLVQPLDLGLHRLLHHGLVVRS